MYYEIILLWLVGINIILQSVRWYWDSQRPPMSSREFIFFTKDVLSEIEKLIQDDSKQRRNEGFSQILSAIDRYNRDQKNKQKNGSNDDK